MKGKMAKSMIAGVCDIFYMGMDPYRGPYWGP